MGKINKGKKAAWKHGNRALIRIYLRHYKATHGCKLCGENRVYCLVFHHREPSSKKFDLSLGRDKAFSKILSEIKKCDVLCANCHLELHAMQDLESMSNFDFENDEQDWLF